jgi:hypothetical protein
MLDRKRIRSLSNKELTKEIASTEVLVTVYSQHLELLKEESGMRTQTLRCCCDIPFDECELHGLLNA